MKRSSFASAAAAFAAASAAAFAFASAAAFAFAAAALAAAASAAVGAAVPASIAASSLRLAKLLLLLWLLGLLVLGTGRRPWGLRLRQLRLNIGCGLPGLELPI